MKRLFGLVLAGVFFFGVFSAPAVAGSDIVKVMTRNQYIGADLKPLILAETDEELIAAALATLTQIAANNFPLRARRLATEVALTKPDLIGLQEVINFTLNGQNGSQPFVDHLDETLEALAAKGQNYFVAATVTNLDLELTIPIPGEDNPGVVRVVDRDVILARQGLEVTPLAGDYTIGGLCGFPVPNPVLLPSFPPTLISTPSENGCNYTIAAEAISPVGLITVERGFVGVDATVRGKTYRFVNTHLEGAHPDPNDPNSAVIQSLQAAELVGTLLSLTPAGMPLILLGDFNSSPEDFGAFTTPYQIIADAGFADVWDTNWLKFFDRDGFTCCQDNDLLNTTSLLDERIDIIFVRNTSFRSLAYVTGRVPIFPLIWPPNWASDHGGVYGKLIIR